MAPHHPYGEQNTRLRRANTCYVQSHQRPRPGRRQQTRKTLLPPRRPRTRQCPHHHVKNPYRLSMLQTRHTGPLSPQAHVSRTNGVAALPMIAVSRSNSSKNNKSHPNGTLGDPHKHHQTPTSVATRHAPSLRHRLWETEGFVQPRDASCTQHAARLANPMSVYHAHPRLEPP